MKNLALNYEYIFGQCFIQREYICHVLACLLARKRQIARRSTYIYAFVLRHVLNFEAKTLL